MSLPALLWLTPVPPLLAFVVLALGPTRRERAAAWVAIMGAAASLVLAAVGLALTLRGGRWDWSVPWMAPGGYRLEWALALEPLTALGATLVSLLCVLVFLSARTSMGPGEDRGRLFTWLSLFAASMLVLVMAADLMTLFIAWELVGICSALLIAHHHERAEARGAAMKAFIVTRVGDLSLLLGILLLVLATGTSRLDALLTSPSGTSVAALLLVLAGAAAKSAQVPFQGWLPDAMAGPTPVSALLHSATMVAAGAYLLARLHPLVQASTGVQAAVAWVGVATALLGGAAALVQGELKRTLAYSTLSQLGFMFLGLGTGSLLAGVLLLVGHACYKALLFLCAGRVEAAVGSRSYADMGGLARRMPWTFAAFCVGALALSGLPATMALPVRDLALSSAWRWGGPLFAAALAASLLTALYTARMLARVFLVAPAREGSASTSAGSHEARRHGRWPMAALAVLTPLVLLLEAGLLGKPLSRYLDLESPHSWWATGLALGTAALGVSAGLWLQLRAPRAEVWSGLRRLAPGLAAELGLRPIYQGASAATLRLVEALGRFDARVFDRLSQRAVDGVLALTRALARVDAGVFERAAQRAVRGTLALVRGSSRVDRRAVDRGWSGLARGILRAGGGLQPVQTGRIDNALAMAFAWVAGALALTVLWLVLR